MEVDEFRNILTAFADKPANVDIEGRNLLVEIRDEIIEARIFQRTDGLWVEENGLKQRADDWVFKRIARLPILADRILTYVREEPYFIEPAGKKLDRMERSPDDIDTNLNAVTGSTLDVLDERPPNVSTGVYLTCDAGEGKTTLIHHIARQQAQRYKEKRTDWLLVPIALGGRPFLRFDDVFIGTLVNRLRFPFLYYDALVWLVRKGAIVPALDGFEEMFVESAAGDAVSALGNLMDLLDSRGTILIAARSAYFEYNDLRTQASLFDSFQGRSADFVRIHLSRWDRHRFVEYTQKREIPRGNELFSEVADKLHDGSHPLLTRPVLIRRLVDVASERAGRDALIDHIGADGELYFERFVESIIRREAHEKWIDRSGVAAHPLLTERQHRELLAEIASEMWDSQTSLLSSDVFDYLVGMYAEDQHLDAQVTKQIHQRIRQHALISASERGTAFEFDHEEFYHYFLGESVARVVVHGDVPVIRRLFRVARIPELAVDVAKRKLTGSSHILGNITGMLNTACEAEPYVSFVRENCGALIARLIDASGTQDEVVLERMAFPPHSLRARRISHARFIDCHFENTELAESTIEDCVFMRCKFERVDVSHAASIRRARLDDCEIVAVVRSEDGATFFGPAAISVFLEHAGFEVSAAVAVDHDSFDVVEPEHELLLTERMCRAFFRSTGVNENTFRKRMGSDSGVFFNSVLPALLTRAVVNEVAYRGSGHQRRYQLGVSLLAVQQSIEQANGSFGKFLQRFGN